MSDKEAEERPAPDPEEVTGVPSSTSSAEPAAADVSPAIPIMSENESGSSWWSSGLSPNAWSGWYESAKEKSTQAYEFMKKDLSEIKDAVQQESMPYINSTSTALTATASYIKETVETAMAVEDENMDMESQSVKNQEEPGDDAGVEPNLQASEDRRIPESLAFKATEKLASVFSSIVDALGPQGFDDDDDVVLSGPDGYESTTIPRDRWDTLVRAIQTDPETYCHEPDGPPDNYEAWLERFSLIDHEAQVERIKNTVPEVRQFYDKLVPKELTHDMFWHRHFYRVEQLKQMELKRIAAKRDMSPTVTAVGKEEVVVTSLKEGGDAGDEVKNQGRSSDQTPSPVSSESSAATASSSKSRATSEDWEKADLTDIVDEATKRLGEKLNAMPPSTEATKSDEEINDWEFE